MKLKEQFAKLNEVAECLCRSWSSAEITIGDHVKDMLEKSAYQKSSLSATVRETKSELKEIILVARYLLSELRG